MEDIKPKPLTEEEILASHETWEEEGVSSAIWAKKRSDEYWKSILLEELEKCWINAYSAAIEEHVHGYDAPDFKTFLTHIKQKYKI